MPNKKQTPGNNNSKSTENKAHKFSKTKNVQSSSNVEGPSGHENNFKKPVRKAGRTLLVKSFSGSELVPSSFDGLTGLVSKTQTKSTSSIFLTFDNVQNSLDAFRKLRADSTDYRVKFSYYRLFFTMNGLTDSTDYNQVKTDMVNHVTSKVNTSVLYCKLYRKDEKYLGCGDLTVDTLEGMNALLSKEGGLKEYTLGSLSGTFYRYNSKKPNGQNQPVSASASH